MVVLSATSDVMFVAPAAPLNPKANLVTRAFAGLAQTAMAESLNPHSLVIQNEDGAARSRTIDENTVVHVSRPYALSGALLLSKQFDSTASERLASLTVANGEVSLAAHAPHAWLNGVALREKGGVKQARIAPNATHRLRVLDSNGTTTDLTLRARPVHD